MNDLLAKIALEPQDNRTIMNNSDRNTSDRVFDITKTSIPNQRNSTKQNSSDACKPHLNQ